jgi:hypothetical protein
VLCALAAVQAVWINRHVWRHARWVAKCDVCVLLVDSAAGQMLAIKGPAELKRYIHRANDVIDAVSYPNTGVLCVQVATLREAGASRVAALIT